MGDQKKISEWTVFFLLKSVGGSIGEAINMLNELRKINYGNEINLVLCLHVVKSYIPAIIAGDSNLIKGKTDQEKTTVFYRFRQKDEGEDGFLNDLDSLGDEPKFDITDPVYVQGFFRDKILTQSTAKRYMLFTWDHGDGFGIFSSTDPEEGEPSKSQLVNLQFTKQLPVIGIKFNNIERRSVPDQDKVLTMDELATAIQRAFDTQKIDLVVMLNCYMQFFDAGYALRNNIKYLVAPQSYMFFNGYNYSFIFRKLVQDPQQSSRKLAKCIVQSFETKLYTDQAGGFATKAGTALFAVDVAYYSEMADALDELASALNGELKERTPELIMARNWVYPVNGATQAVDFINMLESIRKTLGNNWNSKLMRKLMALKKKAVIEGYIGKNFFSDILASNPSGFSIFFPFRLIVDNGVSSKLNVDLFANTSFGKDKSWNKFVKIFDGIKSS